MSERERDETGILTKMFEHNKWASLKLLDYCEGLSAEQLESTAVGCYGTIRDTLSHIVRSEVTYVERVNGKVPGVQFRKGEFAGFASLKEAARWASDEMLELAVSCGRDTLVRESNSKVAVDYTLSSLVVQAITHSTEHRTQIASIITQLGMEPPDMSVWMYMEETGEFRETVLEAGVSGE
jgi:uncharacterized damage-inducible protein DinB